MKLIDMPDDERMQWRSIIEDAGGQIDSYQEEWFMVAIPRPASAFYNAIGAAGMELEDNSLHYFPLGSDNPPEHMRWDGRYPGSKGFWFYGKVKPVSTTPQRALT